MLAETLPRKAVLPVLPEKAYFRLNAVMILATQKITIILRHIYFGTKIGIKTAPGNDPVKIQRKT